MYAFRDLLAWLLGWKSAPGGVTGPYRVVAAQAFATGIAAGELFTTGIAAGEVYAH